MQAGGLQPGAGSGHLLRDGSGLVLSQIVPGAGAVAMLLSPVTGTHLGRRAWRDHPPGATSAVPVG
jgi:hypothetical protein